MAICKPLPKAAQVILNKLLAKIGEGQTTVKIDNAPGAFMAVVVEKLTDSTFSVSHYYEQNGESVADPDMMFYRNSANNEIYAVDLTQNTGNYTQAIWLQGDRIEKFAPRTNRELNQFAAMWMQNIKVQQGGLKK